MPDISVVGGTPDGGRALRIKAYDRSAATFGLMMCRSWHSRRSSIDACPANVSNSGGCRRATSSTRV